MLRSSPKATCTDLVAGLQVTNLRDSPNVNLSVLGQLIEGDPGTGAGGVQPKRCQSIIEGQSGAGGVVGALRGTFLPCSYPESIGLGVDEWLVT